jgi:hypothetical protein
VYPWRNPNAAVDQMCQELQGIVGSGEKLKRSRSATFEKMWRTVKQAAQLYVEEQSQPLLPSQATVPYLNEPWYC